MGTYERTTPLQLARELRRNAVPAERKMWQLLRNRQLASLKFRRQVPVGPFIVDFICIYHQLIVEVDGPIHDKDPQRDLDRDDWLTARGYRVLRFQNQDIIERAHWVESRILEVAGELSPGTVEPQWPELPRRPRAGPAYRELDDPRRYSRHRSRKHLPH